MIRKKSKRPIAAEAAPASADARVINIDGGLVVGEPVDLVVLACKRNAIRCRVLGTSREVTFRVAVREQIPGSILTVTPARLWTYARHLYVAGSITGLRVDATALGLTPLAVHERGVWNPAGECWGDEGDPVPVWAEPIIAAGPRRMFEMENVIPGADPDDAFSDPVVEAAELLASGDRRGAQELLMELLAADLRCLDAHAHLGNAMFDHFPEQALLHYQTGVGIGTLSLGWDFAGVLPWGFIENRPLLRCLHGASLCAWRLGELRTAKAAFTRMLWFNPADHQGARFCLGDIEAGKTWEESALAEE